MIDTSFVKCIKHPYPDNNYKLVAPCLSAVVMNPTTVPCQEQMFKIHFKCEYC